MKYIHTIALLVALLSLTSCSSDVPDGSRANTSNHIITGILFGLEQKGFVEEHQAYRSWELTHAGRRNIQ